MSMNKKIISLLSGLVLALGLSATVCAEDYLESFEATENKWNANAPYVVTEINAEAEYIKDGNQSLKMAYPQDGMGYYLPMQYQESTGYPVANIVGSKKLQKIGVWVYNTAATEDVKLFVQTRGTSNKNITSPNVLLDFTGWKYVEFEVPADTTKLMNFQINSVRSTQASGTVYLDAVSAIYAFDESEKVDLTVSSSLLDQAERVSANPEIVYTFSNPIEEDLTTRITIEPEAEYSLDKLDDKAFSLKLENLTPATPYTVTWTEVTDIYNQKVSKSFTFRTADEFIDLKAGEDIITNTSQIEAGDYSYTLSLVNYNEEACGATRLVLLSFYDAQGVMTGIAAADMQIAEAVGEESISGALSGTLAEAPATVKAIVLDSWADRALSTLFELGGN
ncbi:MAG: hypothetical protein E7397_03435 [Ruminococcaceae bacterium]|nr:hypothetical protein [Oscillospiraceae bacterium]